MLLNGGHSVAFAISCAARSWRMAAIAMALPPACLRATARTFRGSRNPWRCSSRHSGARSQPLAWQRWRVRAGFTLSSADS
eukprot:14987739-Alexandrium_andersonii.AAC.2